MVVYFTLRLSDFECTTAGDEAAGENVDLQVDVFV